MTVAVMVAVVAVGGAVIVPFPSLLSQDLELPVAALAPLAIPAVLGWGLSSSDPRLERAAARRLGLLDVAFVLGWTSLAAVAAVLLSLPGSAEAGIIAARATIGYVGLLLCARWLMPTDVAASVPIGYVLIVSFLGGGSMQSAATWAWPIRPVDDVTSWVLPVVFLAMGLAVLWRSPGSTVRSRVGM